MARMLSHRTDSGSKQLRPGNRVVLLPATDGMFGPGLYTAPLWLPRHIDNRGYGDIEYLFPYDDVEDVTDTDEHFNRGPECIVRATLVLEIVGVKATGGQVSYTCKVVRTLPLRLGATALAKARGKWVGLRKIRRLAELLTPSSCLGPRYRALGLLFGLAALAVFVFLYVVRKNRESSWKWFALGRFLLGIGGKWRIPSTLVGAWDSGVVKHMDNDAIQIRPHASKGLFWIVGTMTLYRQEDGSLAGEDVYDFHPQQGGQNTILGNKGVWGWAWSGGPQDPTQIPRFFWKLDLYKLARRFFPRLVPRYLRTRRKKLLFSNDLWNALGGKPFTSVLVVREEEA